MISESQVEKALKYLGETDEPHAIAKGKIKQLEALRKNIFGLLFQEQTGGVKERESKAYASIEYADYCKNVYEYEYEYQLLSNKRERAKITIDVWRSENANRRTGNL